MEKKKVMVNQKILKLLCRELEASESKIKEKKVLLQRLMRTINSSYTSKDQNNYYEFRSFPESLK